VGELLALELVALAAATVHAALGFGSGPLLAGALLAVAGSPPEAVAAVLWAAVALNLVVLPGMGRPSAGPFAPVWLATPVGALAGAALLGRAGQDALQAVLAGVLVLAAGLALTRVSVLRLPQAAAGRAGVGAGLGAVAATTGIVGPFVAVLLASSVDPARLRAAIAATFLAVSAAALLAQALVVGPGAVGDGALLALRLAPGLALGALAGRWLGARVRDSSRAPLSLAAAIVAALTALTAATA